MPSHDLFVISALLFIAIAGGAFIALVVNRWR